VSALSCLLYIGTGTLSQRHWNVFALSAATSSSPGTSSSSTPMMTARTTTITANAVGNETVQYKNTRSTELVFDDDANSITTSKVSNPNISLKVNNDNIWLDIKNG